MGLTFTAPALVLWSVDVGGDLRLLLLFLSFQGFPETVTFPIKVDDGGSKEDEANIRHELHQRYCHEPILIFDVTWWTALSQAILERTLISRLRACEADMVKPVRCYTFRGCEY